MEVRDLWPDSIQAVEAIEKNTILKILDRLVMFLYRKADLIIVVTDSFKTRLIACNIEAEKIKVVKNGVHMHRFPVREKNQELIGKLGLEGKFVVSYIGTMGMAHGLDFILECAKEVQDKNIHFVLVGEGAMKTRLLMQKQEDEILNVSILDGVPKAEVPDYISITDVALINLRKKNTFTKVIPSKIFENAAMEKPILLGVEGEAAEIINSYNAGRCFEPENKEAFLEQLKVLADDSEIYQSYKAGSRQLAESFDRKRLALKMLAYLSELEGVPSLKSIQVH
jgi:glycosyltransferase involved in cell wall biosynthesis